LAGMTADEEVAEGPPVEAAKGPVGPVVDGSSGTLVTLAMTSGVEPTGAAPGGT
jgi:hypothetical protein